MAIDNIAPGARVTVKIVQRPTNVAATRTLERLLSKDSAAKVESRRQERIRKVGMRTTQRGGRPWEIRVPKQPVVRIEQGAQGTITATLSALRDLRSVSRFVEVAEA